MASQYVVEHFAQRTAFEGPPVPRIWIRQIGSAANKNHREQKEATLRGLRLGKLHQVSVLRDTHEVWGMIRAVHELVQVIQHDFGPPPRYGNNRSFKSGGGNITKARRLHQKAQARTQQAERETAQRRAQALWASPPRPGQVNRPSNNSVHRPEGGEVLAFRSGRQKLLSSQEGELRRARLALADAGKQPPEALAKAIRAAGHALRTFGEASSVTGNASMSLEETRRRLARQDVEHDLLDMLFSDDREAAWTAACEVARSFEHTGERFRVIQDQHNLPSEEVLHAVVEILQAEGQRYFSWLSYSTHAGADAGAVVVTGKFVVSRSLDFGPGRQLELPQGAAKPHRRKAMRVYADGGLKASDVTPDADLEKSDAAVMLANNFTLQIPADQASKPTNVSFVVPGLLIDTIELRPTG